MGGTSPTLFRSTANTASKDFQDNNIYSYSALADTPSG